MARKPDGTKRPPAAHALDPLTAFVLDDPRLPPALAERALTSGGYPYGEPMKRKPYDEELRRLQIELLKLQRWVRDQGQKIVILFEGRDAAGKGGTIRRILRHLNPRHARAVALSKPTEAERGQWYFQRYVAHLPTAGDIVLFDRSWYNRAGVERVMGFCSETQARRFLREAPVLEAALARDDIRLVKYWLTIGREMQLARIHARRHDPLKQWKLSDVDLAAIGQWDAYTAAKEDVFRHTHTEAAPWTVIRANDKRRARINVMRHVLAGADYEGKDEAIAKDPDPQIAGQGEEFFFNA